MMPQPETSQRGLIKFSFCLSYPCQPSVLFRCFVRRKEPKICYIGKSRSSPVIQIYLSGTCCLCWWITGSVFKKWQPPGFLQNLYIISMLKGTVSMGENGLDRKFMMLGLEQYFHGNFVTDKKERCSHVLTCQS